MSNSTKRREFFNSFLSSKQQQKEIVVRPPYEVDENSFHKVCKECSSFCSTVCEENIIKIAKDKTPYLDFSFGGCTFCGECEKVCSFDVLQKNEQNSVINILFEINMLKCLSWNKTMCFSCKDPCPNNAIEFLAMFRPSINQKLCTSCGFCFNVCPTSAIKYTQYKKENDESDF